MKRLFIAAMLLVGMHAQAQTFLTARITGYIPSDYQGRELLVLTLEGNPVGGCNTSGRFAIDSAQPKFKGVRAAVMAAFHSQTPITVAYSQTCNTFSNAWDLSYVCVGSIPC